MKQQREENWHCVLCRKQNVYIYKTKQTDENKANKGSFVINEHSSSVYESVTNIQNAHQF